MIKGIFTGLLFVSLGAAAQSDVQAETDGGKPYIIHTVGTGETLSSLGRAYKLSVSDIAAFNKISADKGLKKDQELRIPLTSSNLSQTECSTCRRVYHKVQPKEGLYRIGLNFGNIKAETLKKLNNLSGESVDIDQNLLVGYLPTSAGKAIASEAVPQPVEKEMPKETVVVKTEKKPEPKQEPVYQPPVVQQTTPPVTKPQETKREEPKKEEPKQTPVVKENPPVIVGTAGSAGNSTLGSGVFASAYDGKAGMAKTGTAAIFKTISGWKDEKYYALMSNVAPGTVVKVTNNGSGKSIYAKVLNELDQQIKQNASLLLRISDAAAAALDGGDENMNVTVSY